MLLFQSTHKSGQYVPSRPESTQNPVPPRHRSPGRGSPRGIHRPPRKLQNRKCLRTGYPRAPENTRVTVTVLIYV